jgi:hypothetical protein
MAARVVGKAATGPSLPALTAEARPLLELAKQVQAAANAAGGEESVRKAALGAAATYSKSVQDFATKQAAEVVAGRLPLAKWRENLSLWRRQGESQLKDAQDRSSWLYKLRVAVGGKVEQAAAAATAPIKELLAKVEALKKQRSSLESVKAKLKGRKLSPEAQETLFGGPAARAEATWKQLLSIVSALQTGVKAITGSTPKPAGMGNVVVGAGAAVATVAVAASLAAALLAYYSNASEVARTEVSKLELELVKQGKAPEVQKLRELRNEADKAREEGSASPFGAIGTAAKWIGGGLLVTGLVIGAREIARTLRPPGEPRP